MAHCFGSSVSSWHKESKPIKTCCAIKPYIKGIKKKMLSKEGGHKKILKIQPIPQKKISVGLLVLKKLTLKLENFFSGLNFVGQFIFIGRSKRDPRCFETKEKSNTAA